MRKQRNVFDEYARRIDKAGGPERVSSNHWKHFWIDTIFSKKPLPKGMGNTTRAIKMTPEQEPHRHAPNAGPLQAIAAANWLPWPRKPLGKSKGTAKSTSPARASRGGRKKGH